MAEYRTEDLRTVALVGHGAAGKTTLAEQLLVKSGMIGAPGAVERGTTVSDYDAQEKGALHSLRWSTHRATPISSGRGSVRSMRWKPSPSWSARPTASNSSRAG
jgi:hypothetical protein